MVIEMANESIPHFLVTFEPSFEANTSARPGRMLVGSSTLEGHGSLAFNTTFSGVGLTVIDFLKEQIK